MKHPDDVLDAANAASFPASDPPAQVSIATAGEPAETDEGIPQEVFRVVRAGEAGQAFAAQEHYAASRWTSAGMPAVYAAYGAAVALLEFLAHLEGETPDDLALVHACVPRNQVWLDPPLPPDWNHFPYLQDVQAIGDRWMQERQALGIRLPSALVPGECNLLVNPLHPHIGKVQIKSICRITLDARLRT